MLWLAQSVALIDQVILRGQSSLKFAELSLKLFPNIIVSALPLAELGAALYVLNLMATHAEILVMQSSGVNPMRIARPFILIGIMAMLILFVFTLYITPTANRELRQETTQIQNDFANNVVISGQFLFPDENITLFADRSLSSGEMVNIFIEDRREENTVRSYFADRGILLHEPNGTKIALIDGVMQESDLLNGEFSQVEFKRSELVAQTNNEAQSLNLWTMERETNELFRAARQNPIANSNALGELIGRVTIPLLGFMLPGIAALYFLSSKYSKHGYSRRILYAALIGIFCALIIFSIPNLVHQNPSMFWLPAIPILIYCFVYFRARRAITK